MKIWLKKDIYGDFDAVDVPENTTAEHIFFRYRDQLPYTPMAAKINNIDRPLTWKVREGDRVELLDMRNRHANLIYIHSLVLVFLKAIWDISGNKASTEIKNSLNQGLYAEIKGEGALTEEYVNEISQRMKEIVELDMPIKSVSLNADMTLEFFNRHGMEDRKEKLLSTAKTKKVTMCEIDGYIDFFYDLMVPSSGYLHMFEVRRYRRGVLIRFPGHQNPSVMPEYRDQKYLYHAFAETEIWQERLGIEYVGDLNEKICKGQMKEVIQLSEALHAKKIVEITKEIIESGKRIIMIAGPSSSGKTTFAKRLCIQLRVEGKNPIYLGTDDYFVNREDTPIDENGQPDYENLEALDIRLFNDDMNLLLRGMEADIPVFDFIEGKKIFGTRKTVAGAGDPIIIEGIHALNDSLTPDIDQNEKFKIYISPLTGLNVDSHNYITTTDNRMLRRMVRDHLRRGKNASITIEEWPRVMKGEEKNIFPYGSDTDAFFNSVHIYEMAILKKYAKPLLEEVKKDDPGYCEAKRLLRFLEFFDEFDDDELIANDSILREFIGGSIFDR